MHIPQPFLPLRIESNNLHHTVRVVGREYTFGPDGLITSIRSQGHELLAGPMRIVMREDGTSSVWDQNYPENESESFIQHRTDEQTVICGTMQSERFIINLCHTVEYDGNIDIDFKLMTRGQTVAQRLGLAGFTPPRYQLDRLWLELPLREEAFTLMNMLPNSPLRLADGTVIPKGLFSMSGMIPAQSASMPFKALLWLGNEDRGLGWFSESDRNWQPADPESAMELVREENAIVLRIRLLDSHPNSWTADPNHGSQMYQPIDFHFGFQATPVKPLPRQPYIHNAFHLDCGVKIKGNYQDFLTENNRFDMLAERGVTTLILHEKWNKSQNFPQLSEYTASQIQYICDECHKRGIKVLTYFGYELSTMSPLWSKQSRQVTIRNQDQTSSGNGWWRVPFQRDHVVCYNSDYADFLVDSIAEIMDTYHIDGVYLDGTDYPRGCYNTEHGCGWYDLNGQLHCTYPVKAIRRMFQRLYKAVSARGGHINLHCSGSVNFTALPYVHQRWSGEDIQVHMMHNNSADVNLDYFRAAYLGNNIGVPVEFIAYENRPIWTFEHALSCALIHGILPRPNDIAYPLELMSGIWKTIAAFPVDQAQWLPYWRNSVVCSHEKVKVSYYRYTTLSGQVQLLAFVSNTSGASINQVTVAFPEQVSYILDTASSQELGPTFSLESFGYRVLYLS